MPINAKDYGGTTPRIIPEPCKESALLDITPFLWLQRTVNSYRHYANQSPLIYILSDIQWQALLQMLHRA